MTMTLEQAQTLATQGKLETSVDSQLQYDLRREGASKATAWIMGTDPVKDQANAVLLAKYWNEFNELVKALDIISDQIQSHMEDARIPAGHASWALAVKAIADRVLAKARQVPELDAPAS